MGKITLIRSGFVSMLVCCVTMCGCAAQGKHEGATAKAALNVRDFGAVGDGYGRDSTAIARAIDAAAAAGGGTVHFPPGTYLTAPIQLKSNITLDLDREATVKFSTDFSDYPTVKTRWEGTECYNSCGQIYGYNLAHVAITGEGKLDGQGKAWWAIKGNASKTQAKIRKMGEDGTPVEQRRFGKVSDGLRPNMIQFFNCRDVRIEGVTITNSPMWMVHPVFCDGVVVRGVTITGFGPNNDGVDPDSCNNVLIENCKISCGDDCIAIKSGRDRDGRRVGIPSQNITVRNCRMEKGHAGVAIGSETSGGIRNVTITDCTFDGTDRGVRMKTMRGRGGVIDNVRYENIKMPRIGNEAIILTMKYSRTDDEPVSERTPTMRNVRISNITCESAGRAVVIEGLAERKVEDVVIRDVKISAKKGVACSDARGVRFVKVNVTAQDGKPMSFKDCTDCEVEGKRM